MKQNKDSQMSVPFTDDELELLRGKYPSIAASLGVSGQYLKSLARGQRRVKSPLSQKCLKKMKEAIDLFKPENV